MYDCLLHGACIVPILGYLFLTHFVNCVFCFQAWYAKQPAAGTNADRFYCADPRQQRGYRAVHIQCVLTTCAVWRVSDCEPAFTEGPCREGPLVRGYQTQTDCSQWIRAGNCGCNLYFLSSPLTLNLFNLCCWLGQAFPFCCTCVIFIYML